MKTTFLVFSLLLVSTLCFAGSIQMSTKDAATGEEKTVIDSNVSAHPPEYSTVPSDTATKNEVAEAKCKRLKKEMEDIKKSREEYRRMQSKFNSPDDHELRKATRLVNKQWNQDMERKYKEAREKYKRCLERHSEAK